MHPTNRIGESILAAAAVVIFLGSTIAAAQPAPTAPVDLVFVNGNVVTVDREFNVAQAVAVSEGRFVRVGQNEEVRALAGPQTRVVATGLSARLPTASATGYRKHTPINLGS